jgi:hypothetical protein
MFVSDQLCGGAEGAAVDAVMLVEQVRRAITRERTALYLAFCPCKCEDVFIHLGSTHVTTGGQTDVEQHFSLINDGGVHDWASRLLPWLKG